MGLIPSARHMATDLAHWERASRFDARIAESSELRQVERCAIKALAAFVAAGRCYVGTSWGKESVIVAHMAARLDMALPVVCITSPADPPGCDEVRDAFLSEHGARIAYEEIHAPGRWDAEGWHATGTLEAGFAAARERHGTRHVSGVRGEESSARALRTARWGESTANTCAPLARWQARHVWAYLHREDLPIHPSYAMSYGGALDRDRLRVAWLGLRHGTGRGRAEWERRYYGPEVAALSRG